MPEPTVPEKQRKTAPPRNDMKSSGLYRNSRALELQNRDPNFEYQYFSTDPESPGYIGHKNKRHEVGDARTGYAMVEGWEVCHDDSVKATRALDPREDQGKPIDTVVRYGRQVLCRIPKSEHAKYGLVDEERRKAGRKALFGSPDRVSGGGADMTAVVSEDENASHLALLKAAGHPMPGV